MTASVTENHEKLQLSGEWLVAPIALLQCTLQLDDSAQLELTSLSRRLGCLNEAVDEERIERGK